MDDPLELDELDESLEELDDDELELGELLLDDDDELLLRLMDELLADPLLEEGEDELLELGELLLEELGDDELLDEEIAAIIYDKSFSSNSSVDEELVHVNLLDDDNNVDIVDIVDIVVDEITKKTN